MAAIAPDGGIGGGTGTPRQTFDSQVLPKLTAECGSCHSLVAGGIGPGFMAAMPDVYTMVMGYTSGGGDLVKPGQPTASTLLTKGAHPPGPAFTPASKQIVEQWIASER